MTAMWELHRNFSSLHPPLISFFTFFLFYLHFQLADVVPQSFAVSSSKDLFDHADPQTSLQVGIGFWLLANAYSAVDVNKAIHTVCALDPYPPAHH